MVVKSPNWPQAGWVGDVMGRIAMLVYGVAGGVMVGVLGSNDGDVAAVARMVRGREGERCGWER